MRVKNTRILSTLIVGLMLAAAVLSCVMLIPVKAQETDYLTVEEMFDLNKLYQDHSDWKSQHASSYDMSEGNLDGQFFYKQSNIKYTTVLLDAKGPGVVTRIWTAGYADDEVRKVLHIYVDGKLLIEGLASDFFGGNIKPFIKPYVGIGDETGGGVYCYVPIVFQESILITAEYANYWNFDYTIFPSDTKVISTVITDEPVLPSWYKVMSHNIEDMTKSDILSDKAALPNNSAVTLFEDTGSGVVEGLNLGFDGLLGSSASMQTFSATGRWMNVGGHVTFVADLNESNNGAIIKWRVDAIWEKQTVDLYVDDEYVGRFDSGASDGQYRYKDIFMEIPARFVAGKSSAEIRLEAVYTGGIDVTVLDLWVYSRLNQGTVLSSYVDVFDGASETKYGFAMQGENGSGVINGELSSQSFKLNLTNYSFPANSAAIGGQADVGTFASTLKFTLRGAGNGNIKLRRTTDLSAAQACVVWVNGRRAGNWTTAACTEQGVGESYFTIPASLVTTSNLTIELVPSGACNVADLDLLEIVNGNTTVKDTVNFKTDSSHDVNGNLSFSKSTYTGADTLSPECVEIMEELRNAIDSYRLLNDLRLQVTYGDDTAPSIDLQLNQLLGMGLHEFYQVKSVTQGVDDNGICYFYLPMPYVDGIKIELVNKDYLANSQFSYKVAVGDLEIEDISNVQLLKVKTTDYDYTKQGEPLSWLETDGSGKLVGLEMSIIGNKSFEYLEGDEIVCVDGNKSHIVYGTGTEDIINSAWYFVTGSFTQAFHGAPTVGHTDNGNKGMNSMYAWYILNQINFRDGIYATIEHGPQSLTQGEQTSITAFYYHNPRAQMVKTDEFTFDTAQTDDNRYREFEGRLEGNYSGEYIIAEGRRLVGSSTYNVKIRPQNNGVMLRRVFSLDNVKQAVEVYVDSQKVGVWNNNYNRIGNRIMRYDDFIIPSQYTQNKNSIEVKFVTLDGYCFDEIKYKAFVLGYFAEFNDTDDDGIEDNVDPQTVIAGDNVRLIAAYQDVSGVSVQISDSALTQQQIDNVLDIIGNGTVVGSFRLDINRNGQAYSLDYPMVIEINKAYSTPCVVVKVGDSLDIFACDNAQKLRFNADSSGEYLVLSITSTK